MVETQETDLNTLDGLNGSDCSDDVFKNIQDALESDNLELLVDKFLNSENSTALPIFSDNEMNEILKQHSNVAQPAKKRHLPRYRKVTRKLDRIFDVSVYHNFAIELYNSKI